MHMMNLYATTSLAKDLGFDLIDIYGISKWKAMQASPLNDPDIVVEMVRNFLFKEFGKHLKINRLWYNYCKAELWKWHKKAEKAYKQAANICKKAERAYWRDCADGGKNLNKLTDGEYFWMRYNIQTFKNGFTLGEFDEEEDQDDLDDSDDEE
ncbi:hypothetical protein RhiirA4_487293 [Rhizophagus irregularis]|uniref:Uncharacterized protein n=1 Tax=Rhizophagus irregularis TaxID=588596 RepID=A0A2I1HSE1_9GLOM|nr:hypothetical protein RhiirA4_487293 [Rhizophagus irregularis]